MENINSLTIILMTRKFKSKCIPLESVFSTVLFLPITHPHQKDAASGNHFWEVNIGGKVETSFLWTFIGLENIPCAFPASLNDSNSSLEIPERVCGALDSWPKHVTRPPKFNISGTWKQTNVTGRLLNLDKWPNTMCFNHAVEYLPEWLLKYEK